jgi:flagellar basal-body rod modification protein FlgD
MTTISATQASGVAPTTASSDLSRASLDYDAFLKLLLEQLKNQDPTNPVDQKESLAQLASFSSVEQAIKMNQKLDSLLAQSAGHESAALIGKFAEPLSGGNGGVVASVEISSAGTFAILANGTRLNTSEGIRVRNP